MSLLRRLWRHREPDHVANAATKVLYWANWPNGTGDELRCPGCGQVICAHDGTSECGGHGEGICNVWADLQDGNAPGFEWLLDVIDAAHQRALDASGCQVIANLPALDGQPAIEVELNGRDIAIVVDGHPRICFASSPGEDDPTLMVWNDQDAGGDAVLIIHLADIPFGQRRDLVALALIAEATRTP